jgi:hypothetical protein
MRGGKNEDSLLFALWHVVKNFRGEFQTSRQSSSVVAFPHVVRHLSRLPLSVVETSRVLI